MSAVARRLARRCAHGLAVGRMVAAAAGLAAGMACAATSDVSSSGFVVTVRVETAASPQRVHEMLAHPERWWSSAHTWSGSASNLSLVTDAGGCFCERWEGHAVEHGRVVHFARGEVLRLVSALGPLQALPVTGVLTFATTAKDGRTTLEATYRVSGAPSAQLDRLATPVDGVIDLQVRRLVRAVETGAPE
jgi:uncharacterized protein YndB with AHSA1/START domain